MTRASIRSLLGVRAGLLCAVLGCVAIGAGAKPEPQVYAKAASRPSNANSHLWGEPQLVAAGARTRVVAQATGKAAPDESPRRPDLQAQTWQHRELESQYEALLHDLGNRTHFARVAHETLRPEALILASDRDPLDVVLRRTAALVADLKRTSEKVSGTLRLKVPDTFSDPRSMTKAEAPRLTASARKSWPSKRSPRSARKALPGRMARVSVETPAIPGGGEPMKRPPVAETSSLAVKYGPGFTPRRGRDGPPPGRRGVASRCPRSGSPRAPCRR